MYYHLAVVLFALLSLCLLSVSCFDYTLCSRDCEFKPCLEWDTKNNCYCVCDNLCSYYGDCCTNISDIPRNLTNQERHLINMSTCLSDQSIYIQHHWSVANCHDNWTDGDIRQLCEERHLNVSNLNLIQHVYYISRSNVTFIFKNKFCAICNGIYDYVPMDILIPNIAQHKCDPFTFKENLKTVPQDALRLLIISGCPHYFRWPDARRWYRTCHCGGLARAPKASLSVLFNFLPTVSEQFNIQEVT